MIIPEELFFIVTILLSIYLLFSFKNEENFKGSGGSGGGSKGVSSVKSGGGSSSKPASKPASKPSSPMKKSGPISPKSDSKPDSKPSSPMKKSGPISPKSDSKSGSKSSSPMKKSGTVSDKTKPYHYSDRRRDRIRDRILLDRPWGGWVNWGYWDYYPYYYYYYPGFIRVFEQGYVPYEEDEDYIYVVDDNGVIKKYKKSCLKEQEDIEQDGKVIKDECLWENI